MTGDVLPSVDISSVFGGRVGHMRDFINRMVRWQGRAQEPGLSALLLLELLAIFLVRPLSELGVLSFRASNIAVSLLLIAGCAVVSRHRFALAAILTSVISGWV